MINIDGYCGKAGFGATDKFCFTRQEGDPEAAACDYLAVGPRRRHRPLGTDLVLQRPAVHGAARARTAAATTPTTSSW